jgi:hypothetical protein
MTGLTLAISPDIGKFRPDKPYRVAIVDGVRSDYKKKA